MEKPHKKLDAWKLSMELVLDVYQTTAKFPSQEKYSLIDQIRRATISIPSNIAEGAARQTKKEFTNYLHIAQGSLSELDTQIDLAKRLGFFNGESCTATPKPSRFTPNSLPLTTSVLSRK
jgi:four helix bundle protein